MELPGYQFGEKLAAGGMATVYRGRQLSLKRPVAIKVLNQQMQKHSAVLEAFERESLIIAQLNHPNIIHVIDRGLSEDGTPFFIMELVDGKDLGTLMLESEVPPMRRVEICLQICKALAYAHKNGVIHRDIKPANVIVDGDLNARVLDFGIALLTRSEADTLDTGASQDVMGTLRYMAPELRLSAQAATVKSDIYSLGVLMYELFAGQLPAQGEHGGIASPSQQGNKLPPRLEKLIVSCLAEDPDKRPDGMILIQDQLLGLLRGSHLNPKQAARAKESVDKKTFTLLDILTENEQGAVYLFHEKITAKHLIVRKRLLPATGFEQGQSLSEISHSNLVPVHGVSKNERAFIIVMDYLRGGNLDDRLLKPFSVEDFLPVALGICAGLQAAHEREIHHGDLRPASILFDEYSRVKLTGFGLQDGETKSDNPVADDILALGKVFYRMLVGEPPRWYRGELQRGKAFKRLPQVLRVCLAKMLRANPKTVFDRIDEVGRQLQLLNEDMATVVLVPEPDRDVGSEKKKLLLLLLLVLFFLTLLNTSVLVLLGLDNEFIALMRESLNNLSR